MVLKGLNIPTVWDDVKDQVSFSTYPQKFILYSVNENQSKKYKISIIGIPMFILNKK